VHPAILIFCGFVAVVAALVLLVVGAAQAGAIERSSRQYRAHDLRVLKARLTTVGAVCGVAVGWFCLLATRWPGIGVGGAAVTVAVCLACVALPVGCARTSVLGAYARVRGVSVDAWWPATPRLAGVLLMAAVLGAAVIALLTAARHSFLVSAVLLVALWLVAYPLLLGVVTPVIAWSRGARALPKEVQQRLSELSARVGVSVRGRMVAGRERKEANAAQLGWLPGLRYVLVTDYLLDELAAPETDAVLAHELGHARHHDLRFVLFSYCLFALALCLVIQEAVGVPSLVIAVDPAAFAAIFVVIAVLRGRLIPREFAADDVAVAAVGPEAVIAMLERLTELNAINPDSSRSWDRRVGHPGTARRSARVRAGQGRVPGGAALAGTAAQPDAPPPGGNPPDRG
jgi:STE24 endopeptidase